MGRESVYYIPDVFLMFPILKLIIDRDQLYPFPITLNTASHLIIL